MVLSLLASLMLCIGNWYGSYVNMQGLVKHRLVGLALATSYAGQVQTGSRTLQVGHSREGDYRYEVESVADPQLANSLRWVRIRVYPAINSEQYVELITGVAHGHS